MDNQNNQPLSPENQKWLDDLLANPAPAPEIQVDEDAVAAVGLTHPDDLELESILSEDWSDAEDLPDLMDQPTLAMDPIKVDEVPAVEVSEEPAPVVEDAPVEQPPVVEPAVDMPPIEEQAPQAPTNIDARIFDEPVSNDVLIRNAPEPKRQRKTSPPEEEIDYRKQRKKERAERAYGLLGIPHLISTVIWLALIVFIGISLGRTLWVSCADLMAFGKEQHKVTVTITEKDDIDTISEKLGKAKLIRYPGLFKMFAEATGKSENISAGTFTLTSQLDYNAMINAMAYHGESREVVEIMFPEGYNCAQIFRLLEQKRVCSAKKLEECVKAATANNEGKQGVLKTDYWFLENVEWGDKYALEGYLFPDTYKFYTNDSPERVLEKFLDNFDARFTDLMMEDYKALQSRFGLNLSVHDVITIASIIQKETSSASESYDIGSVFYNRLVRGDVLGSDATVYYAIGDYFGEKDELSAADLSVNSPYNTRNEAGVPPGPICSPGRESLYAALDPNPTNYYFFVYDSGSHKHLFSVTEAEHERKCRELGLW